MQHNNHKKESFKLLQLSDDSKSLSELELPQVSTVHPQRKRKILRKTRNTSPHSSRLGAAGYPHGTSALHAHDASTSSDGLMASACSSNFGLWIAVVMTCGWLFILSYMTAVVYSENRRLEAQLFKLSASSQTVPDELQHWHESAHWLEQNQTAMQLKLGEVDGRAAALAKDMQALRVEFKEKYDDSSDHEKVSRLQNNVANFGAQLKDLNIDVSTLKERTSALRTAVDTGTTGLRALNDFVHTANTSLGDAARSQLSNATVLWLVHNVTEATRTQLQQVADELAAVKYTTAQQTKGLEDDVRLHKQRLDELTENSANVTAHVVSIETSLREHAALMAGGPVTAVPAAQARITMTTTASPQSAQLAAAAAATAQPLAAKATVVVVGDLPAAPTTTTTTMDPALLQVLSGGSSSEKTAAGRR